MKKILFLVGTRPEVIKIAPVLSACRQKQSFLSVLCTSGQHDTLLSDTLADFRLSPDCAFQIVGDDLGEKQSECMHRFDRILRGASPDAVAVHGDTLTAFTGGLAAFYRGIPVFHVEAGLRTDTPFSPFPEEFYRRAIDHLSTLHFAPTARAAERLLREGIRKEGIYTVGNTAIDGLFEDIDPCFAHPILKEEKKLVLVTLHRRESLGTTLTEMLRGIAKAIHRRQDTRLFFPMHPNPILRDAVKATLAPLTNAVLSEPVDTHTFRNLLACATVALTDSGGVSEEATALGTPTLLLRDETERPEGVDVGALHLVGRKAEAIYAAVTDFLDTPRPHTPSSVFGDGHASPRIAEAIEAFFS
ncbi:MAG: UDP-N-acetylglucosamine 2-epimerase (non-hydrolyzing) [Ruminococcaceae bacterium]|nr:UDP-N-acetylglucosamine 2-epimerase (non-hydrolyzing) [Oscillospiraceae bacterium]